MGKSNTVLSSFAKILTAMALLSSCAKTDYDGRIRLQGLNNPTPQATPQGSGNTPGGGGAGVTPAANLPVISFTETVVLMDSKLVANLELQLSEPSKQKVVAVIDLVDVTARHGRDFSGFMTPSRNNETTQIITFSPGETRKPLPPIGGRIRYADLSRSCDSDFLARINAMKLQGARVVEDRAAITVPCAARTVKPPRPQPQPPVTPAPEPIPGPVLPPPVIELPEASFEKPVIVVEPNGDMAIARVILNKPTDVNVLIELETKSGSGYEPKMQKVIIPANELSVEFPVKIVREDICKANRPAGSVDVATFNIVANDIVNAKMVNKVARVVVKDDSSRCPPQVEPPPTKPIEPPPQILPNARFEKPRLDVGPSAPQVSSKILLDKPALQDVLISIETQDGTAKSNIDYITIKKPLIIKKDESSVDVPVSLLRPDKCAKDASPDAGKGGEFLLVVTEISGADMQTKTQVITIPEDKRDCPKPVIVKARFENKDLSNAPNSEDVMAKIILNEPSDLPVVIDIETQDGSAAKGKDYVRLVAVLTIAPGQTEIEIPLKLLLDKTCVPQDLAANLNLPKQFNLIVTKISKNATMEENTAAITVNNVKSICQPLPPPVSKPPVTQPEPPPVTKPAPPVVKPPVPAPAPSPRPAPAPQPAPAPKPEPPPATKPAPPVVKPPVPAPAPSPKPAPAPAPKPEPPATKPAPPPVTKPAPPPATKPAPPPVTKPEPPPATKPAPPPVAKKPPVPSPSPSPRPEPKP